MKLKSENLKILKKKSNKIAMKGKTNRNNVLLNRGKLKEMIMELSEKEKSILLIQSYFRMKMTNISIHNIEEKILRVQNLCRKFIGYQRYKRINQKIYAAREFLDTERSYLGGLNTLKNKFLEPLREIVDPAILRVIFCEKELGNIIVYNETLMKKLEDVNQNTNYFTPIGEIINQITPFFKIYTVYVNGYDAALSMVNEERERNTNFDKFFKRNRKRRNIISVFFGITYSKTSSLCFIVKRFS